MSDTPDKIRGSCLCGGVSFEMLNDFSQFYFCHCQQCQKTTGSAHAANLFTRLDNIEWLSGESLLKHFSHASRDFHKVFCKECGSGLPWPSGDNSRLTVPAGCLDSPPSIKPNANLFWSEHASWLEDGRQAEEFDKFAIF